MKLSRRKRITLVFSVCLLIAAIWIILNPTVRAANPATGAISPTGANVVWQGPVTGGAGANEDTCVEGANCDTFKLTLTGTEEDWAGKVVNITINWTNPANDYDLYIHKGQSCPANGPCDGPVVSQDGNGSPSTQEAGSIDPSSTGTGLYLVRLVVFSAAPGDPFTGTASVGPEPPGRKANYVKDGITFSPNVTVKAPSANRDGEPSNRTDKFGNHYTSAIRGVPAGVDLWYFDLATPAPVQFTGRILNAKSARTKLIPPKTPGRIIPGWVIST